MLKILVLSAIPQEYSHLRKITPRWRQLGSRPFKTFSFDLAEKEIVLVETGMGAEFAAHALEAAIARFRPDLLVFAGFCGGLHPDLSVGDLCVVRKVLMVDSSAVSGKDVFTFYFSTELSEFLSAEKVRPIKAVMIPAPEEKTTLAALLGGALAAADMETAKVSKIACLEGLPLLVLRSVSDALDDDLGFDLAEITGKDGRVSLARVVRTVMANPPVLKAFYRAWRRSDVAGENLGRLLGAFLRLPAGVLARIAEQTGCGAV
jgi:adenosylhomocysteine nucleosidase